MWMVRSHRVNILYIYYLFILFIHSVIPFICCSTALLWVRAMSTKGELNLSTKQNIFACSTFLMLPLKNPLRNLDDFCLFGWSFFWPYIHWLVWWPKWVKQGKLGGSLWFYNLGILGLRRDSRKCDEWHKVRNGVRIPKKILSYFLDSPQSPLSLQLSYLLYTAA